MGEHFSLTEQALKEETELKQREEVAEKREAMKGTLDEAVGLHLNGARKLDETGGRELGVLDLWSDFIKKSGERAYDDPEKVEAALRLVSSLLSEGGHKNKKDIEKELKRLGLEK